MKLWWRRMWWYSQPLAQKTWRRRWHEWVMVASRQLQSIHMMTFDFAMQPTLSIASIIWSTQCRRPMLRNLFPVPHESLVTDPMQPLDLKHARFCNYLLFVCWNKMWTFQLHDWARTWNTTESTNIRNKHCWTDPDLTRFLFQQRQWLASRLKLSLWCLYIDRSRTFFGRNRHVTDEPWDDIFKRARVKQGRGN